MPIRRRLLARGTFLAAAFILAAGAAWADRSLETKYTTLRFAEDSHLNDFLWRITGSRLPAGQIPDEPVKSRVDEIVERVESLLDMYPENLRFEIRIDPRTPAAGQPCARYAHGDRRVIVSPKTVTDGILAHEVAHAVICAQFPSPPPEKAQEILARYVDENLWRDA